MKKFLLVLALIVVTVTANAMAIREEIRQKEMEDAALKDFYGSFFMVGNIVSPHDIAADDRRDGGQDYRGRDFTNRHRRWRGERRRAEAGIAKSAAGQSTAGQDSGRFEMLVKHFDILTAENAMKPVYLQDRKGEFTFKTADEMVNAVLKAGLKMHGHTLAWHQQSPGWMNYEGINRDEAIENLITHAKTVASHFKGRIISWDVLNEAIVDNPATPNDWKSALRHTPWFRAIGSDYIELLFIAAREADPDAILYYNDYNLDTQGKAIAVYNMVKELNEKYPDVNGRKLIDGIGMQGHYSVNTNVGYVERSLKRFVSLGVEVSITELDIQAGTNGQLSEEQELEQAIVFAKLYTIFRENSESIGRVTIWGLDDNASWRRDTSPVIFDGDLQPKQAFFAVLDPAVFLRAKASRFVKSARETQRAQASYGSPSFNANDPLWQKAQDIYVNQYLMAWQGAHGRAKVLWDEENLYVRVEVENAQMNKRNPAPHEQDSIEIFIDESNEKEGYFHAGDGQFRVNFDNELSVNPYNAGAGFESRCFINDASSYTIIAKIPFKTVKPHKDMVIGFDLQINGASSHGIRQSVAVWNDLTSNAWQDPSLFGILKLVK